MSGEANKTNWEEDPRITAYALGELDGTDRAAVEALLDGDEAARARVEGLRALSRDLERALEDEIAVGEVAPLSADARSRIESEARGLAPARRAPRFGRWARIAASLVGLAVIGAATAVLLDSRGMLPGSERVGFLATAETAAPAERIAARPALKSDLHDLRGLGYVSDDPAMEPDASLEDPETVVLRYRLDEVAKRISAEDARLGERVLERARELAEEVDEEYVLTDREILLVDEYADELGVDFRGLDDGETYATIHENDFLSANAHPVSTFSVDVDTASYSNVRRFLREGNLPPADAVRIEELVNYFPYDYALPKGEHPFAVDVEVGAAPWAPRHRLLRIGLRSSPLGREDRRPSNLVFLLDVSGSMDNPDKLPLVKQSLRMLVEELDARDRVSIVVYAGAAGVVLEPTGGEMDLAILAALERLDAGGSTNGGEGIQRAYQLARENFLEDGNNRVILATDGDFNVGITGEGALEDLIVEQAASGVFLTVLGFGSGNLQDATMETLADKGNGHYAYIDSLTEARKVLVGEVGASLETVAKDVKVQLVFNPRRVAAYRLIGYENRLLDREDFDDDTKDAGEIGAGHRVTALYELVPAGEGLAVPGWDERIASQDAEARADEAPMFTSELGQLRLRYKAPQGTESRLLEQPLTDSLAAFQELSGDTRFAASVAAYGMLLRGSKYAGSARWRDVIAWASAALGEDQGGYRGEFRALAIEAQRLSAETR